jgi:hypothetical protein
MKITLLDAKEDYNEAQWKEEIKTLINSLFEVKHINEGLHDLFVGKLEIPENEDRKTFLKNIYKIGNWGFDLKNSKTFFTANIVVRTVDHKDNETTAKIYFFFPAYFDDEDATISSQVYGLSSKNTGANRIPFIWIKEELSKRSTT